MYLNDFSSDIFKSLNVDNQMSLSCGQDEPLSCPENDIFSCLIGIYLVSFFFDHPVILAKKWFLDHVIFISFPI